MIVGDVTKNLSTWEWECRDNCGQGSLHPTVIQRLQDIRTSAGKPMTITSGCRCKAHNKNEGGASNSYHLPKSNGYCWAADWLIEDLTLGKMYNLAMEIPEFKLGGIGVYLDEDGPRIHTDVRLNGPYHFGVLDGVKVSIATALRAAADQGV